MSKELKESHNYDHSHDHFELKDTKAIKYTFFINLTFAIIEFIMAILTNSIALYSNSIHDFGDSIILLSTIFIERFSLQGRSRKYTYGYRRFTLVGAIINSVILLVASVAIIHGAIIRLIHPEPINPSGIIIIAIFGILTNGFGAYKLSQSNSEVNKSLKNNLMGDVFNWIGLLVAGVLIKVFNLLTIDAVISFVIAIGMIVAVLSQTKSIFRMLMQAVPSAIDIDEITDFILSFDKVIDCHDLHIWTLDGEDYIMSFHLVVSNKTTLIEMMDIKEEIKLALEKFHINHTTIEVDNEFQAIKNGELDKGE